MGSLLLFILFHSLIKNTILESLRPNKTNGILFMLLASFCFAFAGGITRKIGKDLGSIELVFFRNIIGVIFVLFSVFRRPLKQVGGKPWLLIFRGVIGTLALYSFFYSIVKIGLAEAITYQQGYPIILAVLSFWLFKERLGIKEWAAVLIGFCGILFIFLPQINGAFSLKHHSVGIINMFLTALAYLSIKGLSKFYETRAIVLSFMIAGIILPIISFVLGEFISVEGLEVIIDHYKQPVGVQWLYLLVLGVVSMIGQIYLTKAFSYGKGGVISTVGYSNILFSIGFGWLLGDAFPGFWSCVGIVLVIVSGTLIAFKE